MERLINRSPSKSYIDNSIVCDKCHKWIKYNYYYGYSHRCSGRTKEIRKVAYKRFCAINSIQNRDTQIFGMYDLAGDLDSASVVYDPTANKLSRKDIEMNNRKRDRIENLVRSIDRAKERISYWEELRGSSGYDILIRDNISNTEPEVIENGYEIINQIIHSYRQSLERYNKELDELLTPETTGNEQYVPPKDKRWRWWKEE